MDGPIGFYAAQTLPYSADAVPEEATATNAQTERNTRPMWQQTYDPLNSPVLSALVAAVPIILFLLGLTVLKLSGLKSALLTLGTTLIIGCAVFGLPSPQVPAPSSPASSRHVAHRLDCADGCVALPHRRARR